MDKMGQRKTEIRDTVVYRHNDAQNSNNFSIKC